MTFENIVANRGIADHGVNSKLEHLAEAQKCAAHQHLISDILFFYLYVYSMYD